MMKTDQFFLFADFACPYSYITETMVRRRTAETAAALTYYAYELHPASAPLPPPDTVGSEVAELAREAGIPLLQASFRPRTGKAHELAKFAREGGMEERIREALYRAYWEHGSDIGRVDVLTGIAERHGIDPSEAKVVLDIDRYSALVARERELAVEAGITETPTVVIGTGTEARSEIGARHYAAWVEVLPGG